MRTSENSMSGKTALITGGGRGIGRAIALAFAREGASVAVMARTAHEVEAVAEEVRALGADGIALVVDVAAAEAVFAAVDRLRERWPRLDVLVNNAGGGEERAPVLEGSVEGWLRTIAVNLGGTYLCTKAILPWMIEGGGGKILNVGSGMGHEARGGNSSYNTAKAAVWMFTRCLALEVWQHGIDVNELVPGPVATHLTASVMPASGPPPWAPSEQIKRPEDVAPLAVFLATQPPGGPTGQSFSLARRPI
jgi:3-oxoacyl-[acyl-carrier protein] reductase